MRWEHNVFDQVFVLQRLHSCTEITAATATINCMKLHKFIYWLHRCYIII